MRAARYETIGAGYARTRREDPRLRARIHAVLGDARTVVNVGAGAGSYEPRDRHVIAIEPSDVMAAQRPPELAPAIRGTADDLALRDDAVDAAMAVLTVHHWDAGLERGVRELRRVARGPVVIVTYDAAVSGGWWLMRDYLPEVAAMDHRIFPPLDRLAGGSAGTSPSTRCRWRPTRRTGRSAPSGRIPGACSTPRRGRHVGVRADGAGGRGPGGPRRRRRSRQRCVGRPQRAAARARGARRRVRLVVTR
jgi:SAM-dependent methyltransferase